MQPYFIPSRLYYGKNESLSQHSCLVYDPYYCQPNLNRIDTQQNLLYPQDQPEKEQKKPKKSKKKTTTEKTVRENAPLVDYSKEDLIAWLKSLPLEERFEVFSIKNAWLAIAFVKMYQRWSESHNSHFALFLDDNNKISSEKNGLEFGDLENHFLYRHAGSENNAQMAQAEKEIIDSIRIYDNEELYEMIGFKEDTIQDIDKVIKLFGIISGETAFTRPCKVGNDPNSKSNAFDMPIWFNPNSFQTLAAWIVSNFEKAIWTKYIHNKKHPKQSSSSFDVFDFKLTVNYKKSLTEFWKGLEKSKKKKIVQVGSDTLHSLSGDNSKPQPSEGGKDINQALKLFYENPLYARARGSMTTEGLCAYFNHLFEDGNELTVIETILMTPLSQFGTIPNLICRKISHKLKNMMSEKIASDLILNEEREKKQNQKKKPNKKKKLRKPAQNNAEADSLKTEEINIEIKPKDNSIAYKEESKIDSLWCDNRGISCSLVGSNMPETEYVEIKDLESQQTFNMVRVRKAEENFINHFTETSTTNASESEEKNENEAKQKSNQVRQAMRNKKHSKKNKKSESKLSKEIMLNEEVVPTLWEAQISQDEKDMLKDVSEVTKATEAAAAAIIDDWSIFEDLGKKVSKSQKKKQKKKAKKLEQEKQGYEQDQDEKKEEEIELMVLGNNRRNSLDDVEKNKLDSKGLQRAKTFETSKGGVCTIENVEEILQDNLTSVSQKGSNESSRKNSDWSSVNPRSSTNNDISQSEVSSTNRRSSETFTKDFWKEDVNTKTFPITTATPDFDDGGFIEVKAKKKPEKEKKPKGRREPKDSWKKKKEKEPVEKNEKKKGWKDNSRNKSPPKSAELKKAQSENRGTTNNVNNTDKSATLSKCEKPLYTPEPVTDHDIPTKKTVIITTEVQKSGSTAKIIAPKPVKKSAPIAVVPTSASSHSSESENAVSTTKSTGQSSHTSHTSHSTKHSSSHSVNNQTSDHSDHGHRSHPRSSHPLSISSPSLELETIKIAKAKELATEFFNKKFESDIYEHVATLTDEANKMTEFRILAYKRLEYCIGCLFPNTNVKTKIFGSCATGLALKMSDVDIAVSGLGAYERYALCDYLLMISDTLSQFKWITKNQPILTATVPILKLEIDLNVKFGDTMENQKGRRSWNIPTDQKECFNVTTVEKDDLKITVDLSIESMGIVGYNLHVGYKTTDFVQKMLEKHDSLYIVTMVLKEFLHNRKLLNAYRGGISSYTLVVMIVALFQKFGDEGYMASLRRFFNFYGEIFKPENTGITLMERDPFFPLSHSYETAPLWVIVEHNSFDRKNIGQGAYSIKAILHEFEKASKTIQYCRQKLEEICVKHHNEIKCAEDISKISDDELKTLLSSNILELFIKDV